MKKLLFALILGMFLLVLPTVLAVRVDYSPNEKGIENMKAEIKDTILFGLVQVGEQGTMELKSHKSPTDVLKVGAGWQVTMIYDTNFGKAHQEALGDVYFYDVDTGKEVNKEYKIVYLDGELAERNICVKYDSPDLTKLEDTNMTDEEIEEYVINYKEKCIEYEKETYGRYEKIYERKKQNSIEHS